MLLDTATKTKIGTLTNVEDAVLFLSILLQDTYQNTRVVEGLDSTNAEVSVNACSVDFLPVVRASGTKEYRMVTRTSLAVDKAIMYRAAKWSYVTPFGSDSPNATIVGIANNT